MTNNSLFSMPLKMTLLTAGVVLFSHAAMADFANYNCTEKIDGKTVQVVATVNSGSRYDVTLTVDGKNLPVAGGQCFGSNRPSTTYELCAFKWADKGADQSKAFELDVYPWIQTTSGMVKVMQYVLWTGDQPSTPGKFTNCASH